MPPLIRMLILWDQGPTVMTSFNLPWRSHLQISSRGVVALTYEFGGDRHSVHMHGIQGHSIHRCFLRPYYGDSENSEGEQRSPVLKA